MSDAEILKHNREMLKDYEPVGSMFDMFFKINEEGHQGYTIYLPYYDGVLGDWIHDLEPIHIVKEPVLGVYNVGAGERVFELGNPYAREFVWRQAYYDTVLYRKKQS